MSSGAWAAARNMPALKIIETISAIQDIPAMRALRYQTATSAALSSLGATVKLGVPPIPLPEISKALTTMTSATRQLNLAMAVATSQRESMRLLKLAPWQGAFKNAWTPSVDLQQLVERLRISGLPSNLRDLPGVHADDILNFTLEHGIALYLVPRATIAKSLLSATDAQAVRRILGAKCHEIVADCRHLLSRCELADTLTYREYTLQALNALEVDAFAPAQAMAANVLDGLLKGHLTPSLQHAAKRKTGETVQDVKDRIDDLTVWEGYIASALWSTFAHYFQDRGDAVPYAFSRHATAHAPGRRQYSRRSAVQGLMAASAAIGFMNGLQ